MKRRLGMTLVMVASVVLALPGLVASVVADDQPPPMPQTPAAVDQVVYARTFSLEQGYPFAWRQERPWLTEGTILVLEVEPALAYLRQGYNPVLYVGDTTAERVNHGFRSGYILVIVPGFVDPAKTPIWFGSADVLPENVDADKIATERVLAEQAGIGPQAAASTGGPPLRLVNRDALQPRLAALLERYAPRETDLINQLKVPVRRAD